MSLAELIEAAEFVVDTKGHKKAVMLKLEVWHHLLQWLAALEDEADAPAVREIEARLDSGQEQLYPHDEVWAEIEALEAAGALPD